MANDSDQIAVNTTEIGALKLWQQRQNGTLDKLETKIDRLLYWIMGLAATVAIEFGVLLFYLSSGGG